MANFVPGKLAGYRGDRLVMRLPNESDDALLERAATLMAPVDWGGIVMSEVRA
jgi:hypothetical protein